MAPAIVTLVLVVGALVGAYVFLTSGGTPTSDDGVQPPRPPQTLDEQLALGQREYINRCSACHQESGSGLRRMAPPLVGSTWVSGPPWRLKRILLHGMEGPVEPGGDNYQWQMVGFGSQLEGYQLAAVMTYIRAKWGEGAGPISAASVEATRRAEWDRREPWTMAELLAIDEPDYLPPLPEPAGAAGDEVGDEVGKASGGAADQPGVDAADEAPRTQPADAESEPVAGLEEPVSAVGLAVRSGG